MYSIIMIGLMFLDLWILSKILKENNPPTEPVQEVVYINSTNRPRRGEAVYPLETIKDEVEDLDYKEYLKWKVVERRKAWENQHIWNKEDNLIRYKQKYGLISEEEVNNINKTDFERGLFSFKAI